jgi:copper chaperone CopZ
LVDRLKRVKGVKDVTLNLFTQQVSVDHEGADMEEVMRVINRLGLKVAGSEAK